MSVESATYINGLDSSKPAASDPKAEGDDHLRLLKSTIKASFPNVSGAVSATHGDLSATAGAGTTGATAFRVATQSAADNTTLAASTAMVQAAILASSGISGSLPAQSGNAGKFLSTNGTSPSWSPAGSWVALSSVSASNSATVDLTGIDGTYDAYAIEVVNAIPATASAQLYLRTSSNGGGSYDSGANDYITSYASSSSSTSKSSVVSIGYGGAYSGLNGLLYLIKPSGAYVTGVVCSGTYWNNAGTDRLDNYFLSFVRAGNVAVNAVRFLMSTGNITSGTFRLYGIRNS